MRLEFVQFNFIFRQGFFRNMKKIRSCRRILSDARAKFAGYTYTLSYNKVFGISTESKKLSVPPEVVLSVARSYPYGISIQNSFI